LYKNHQKLGDFISDEVKAFEKGAIAVTRMSINDIVDDANLHTGKGGRMRVKTGFLRNSGRAKLNSWPVGPTRGDPNATLGQYDNGSSVASNTESLVTALSTMKMGDTLYYGWTAAYAPAREAVDGFMESAIAKWRKIVETNSRKYLSQKGK
jgi:hypothetical protein